MSVFKIMSVTLGTVVTIGAAYGAQKKINMALNDEKVMNGERSDSNAGIRIVTAFAVTTIVGGVVNSIINNLYNN